MSVDGNSEAPFNPSGAGGGGKVQPDVYITNQPSMRSSSSYNSGQRGISYYRAIRDSQSVHKVIERKIQVPKIKMSHTQIDINVPRPQTPNVLDQNRLKLVNLKKTREDREIIQRSKPDSKIEYCNPLPESGNGEQRNMNNLELPQSPIGAPNFSGNFSNHEG